MARKPSSKSIIATNLNAAILKSGIAKNTVADQAGVSRSQMYDVLAGRKAATIDWLVKIGDALDIEAWTLLKPKR